MIQPAKSTTKARDARVTAKKSSPKPRALPALKLAGKPEGHAAFAYFLPLAEARVASGEQLRGAREVSLVRTNVERGAAAALAHHAAIVAKLPGLDIAALAQLPALVAALDYAASRVPVLLNNGQVAAALAEVRPLRALMLSQLEILGTLGLVAADRVAAIRSGSGPLDTARDAVAIAGMFREYERAIAGKHPFAAEHVATLSSLGDSLLSVLTPTNSKSVKADARTEVLLRDALYAEVMERYERLREAAVAAFGLKDLDEKVPPAHSRQAASKKKPAATLAE